MSALPRLLLTFSLCGAFSPAALSALTSWHTGLAHAGGVPSVATRPIPGVWASGRAGHTVHSRAPDCLQEHRGVKQPHLLMWGGGCSVLGSPSAGSGHVLLPSALQKTSALGPLTGFTLVAHGSVSPLVSSLRRKAVPCSLWAVPGFLV